MAGEGEPGLRLAPDDRADRWHERLSEEQTADLRKRLKTFTTKTLKLVGKKERSHSRKRAKICRRWRRRRWQPIRRSKGMPLPELLAKLRAILHRVAGRNRHEFWERFQRDVWPEVWNKVSCDPVPHYIPLPDVDAISESDEAESCSASAGSESTSSSTSSGSSVCV